MKDIADAKLKRKTQQQRVHIEEEEGKQAVAAQGQTLTAPEVQHRKVVW